MCKVLTITNSSKIEVNQKLLTTIKDLLTEKDNDGFGYAVLNQDLSLAGEKCLNPEDFTPLSALRPTKVSSLPIIKKTRASFGRLQSKKTKSLIAHGRMSTNSIRLENTHPFTTQTLAMVHNGVVDDASDLIADHELKTNCDSELILRHWEKGGLKQVESWITGYYAFAVLDRSTGLLHVVRDSRATLYISYSRTIDSYIIATTREIVINLAKEMQWNIEEPELISDNLAVTFDGNTIIEHVTISPKGYASTIDASKVELSLGSEVYGYEDEYRFNDDSNVFPMVDCYGKLYKGAK